MDEQWKDIEGYEGFMEGENILMVLNGKPRINYVLLKKKKEKR